MRSQPLPSQLHPEPTSGTLGHGNVYQPLTAGMAEWGPRAGEPSNAAPRAEARGTVRPPWAPTPAPSARGLAAETSRLRSERDALGRHVSALQLQLHHQAGLTDQLRAQLSNAQALERSLRTRGQMLEHRAREAETQVAGLTEERDIALDWMDHVEVECSHLERALDEARRHRAGLDTRIEQLTRAEREARVALKSAETQLHTRLAAAEARAEDTGSRFRYNVRGALRGEVPLSLITQEPASLLALQFGGRWSVARDAEGFAHVDCEPRHFQDILNWQSCRALPEHPSEGLIAQAEYWGLDRFALELRGGSQAVTEAPNGGFSAEVAFTRAPDRLKTGELEADLWAHDHGFHLRLSAGRGSSSAPAGVSLRAFEGPDTRLRVSLTLSDGHGEEAAARFRLGQARSEFSFSWRELGLSLGELMNGRSPRLEDGSILRLRLAVQPVSADHHTLAARG